MDKGELDVQLFLAPIFQLFTAFKSKVVMTEAPKSDNGGVLLLQLKEGDGGMDVRGVGDVEHGVS